MTTTRQVLCGWGGTNPTAADVVDVGGADEAAIAVARAGTRGALARGLGRSYGDAAQNSGGLVVRLHESTDAVVVDAKRGVATVPGGVSIDELLHIIIAKGFFVPVTPGTRFVTVGGAIACDIHGKNHHVDGSFGTHVLSLDLLMADGSVETISPRHKSDLFWATIGGMGLTGIVLTAVVRLIPIETSRMLVTTDRVPDLDGLLALMTEGDDKFRYSVAWVDLLARGRHLGRSVLTRGDHARTEDVMARGDPLAYDPRHIAAVPAVMPPAGVLSAWSVAAFNEMWFRKSPRHREREEQTIARFFHPLDGLGGWNRLYGSRGFVQYQFVVPMDRSDVVRRVVELLSRERVATFLAILKRFGPANAAPLSFPLPGWTLTLDAPSGHPGLGALFSRFDDLILDAGGRHYFAKDAYLSPSAARRGYPRLAEWQSVRDAADPIHRWQSDLGRRLQLVGPSLHVRSKARHLSQKQP